MEGKAWILRETSRDRRDQVHHNQAKSAKFDTVAMR